MIAYQGAVAHEAIAAAGRLGELRRDIGILAVTSADRLNVGWTATQRDRTRGNSLAKSHVEHFGRTGTVGDLYKHYGLNRDAIVEQAQRAITD